MLGMRKATTKASKAGPAPNRKAKACSRTSPRRRLIITAALTDEAERAMVVVSLAAVFMIVQGILKMAVPREQRPAEGQTQLDFAGGFRIVLFSSS